MPFIAEPKSESSTLWMREPMISSVMRAIRSSFCRQRQKFEVSICAALQEAEIETPRLRERRIESSFRVWSDILLGFRSGAGSAFIVSSAIMPPPPRAP